MEVLWWVIPLLGGVLGERDVAVTLDMARWQHLTSDKFLSLSISPSLLLSDDASSTTATSLLRSLSPGYLRLETDQMMFSTTANSSGPILFTDAQWLHLNQLARKTGLSLIVGTPPQAWVDGEVQRLLQLSEEHGFNPAWQMAYNSPDLTQLNSSETMSGKDYGHALVQARQLLDSSTRHQRTAVIGPDLVICEQCDYAGFLAGVMQEARHVANIIPVHMRPQTDSKSEEKVLEELATAVDTMDSTDINKEDQNGSINKLPKKQFWLVEPGVKGSEEGFTAALQWAQRLGEAASLGYQVILRHVTHLTDPTPDYWVSLLHRNLVGRTVLSPEFLPGDASVAVFTHCTAHYERPTQRAVDAMSDYQRGAVTVWGVNTAQESSQLTLHTDTHEAAVHLYILTGDRQSGYTLLNDQLLEMKHGLVPTLSPVKYWTGHNVSVAVPARSVFYVVMPDSGAPACLSSPPVSMGEDMTGSSQADTPTLVEIPFGFGIKETSFIRKGDKKEDGYVVEKGGLYDNENKNILRDNSLVVVEEKLQNASNDEEEKSISEENIGITQYMADNKDMKMNNSLTIPGNNNKLYKIPPSNESDALTKEDLLFLLDLLSKMGKSLNKRKVSHSSSTLNMTGNKIATEKQPTENGQYSSRESKNLEFTRTKRSEDNDKVNKREITENSPFYRMVNQIKRAQASNLSKNIPNTSEDMNQDYLINQNTKDLNSFQERNRQSKVLDPSQVLSRHYKAKVGGTNSPVSIDGRATLPRGSVTDIEDPHEAVAETAPGPRSCNNGDSRLRVSAKQENDHQEDRAVVESATEQMEHYYRKADLSARSGDVFSRKRKGKHGSTECCFEDKDISEEAQPPVKSEEDTMTADDTGISDSSYRFKPNAEMTNEQIGTRRIKRKIDLDKSNIEKFMSELQTQDSVPRYDYSDEEDLRELLDELTAEGEELLQSFDKEVDTLITKYSPDNNSNFTEGFLKEADKQTNRTEEEYIPDDEKTESFGSFTQTNSIFDDTMEKKMVDPKVPTRNSVILSKMFENINEPIKSNDNSKEIITPVGDIISDTTVIYEAIEEENQSVTGQTNNNRFEETNTLNTIEEKNNLESSLNDGLTDNERDITVNTNDQNYYEVIPTATIISYLPDEQVSILETIPKYENIKNYPNTDPEVSDEQVKPLTTTFIKNVDPQLEVSNVFSTVNKLIEVPDVSETTPSSEEKKNELNTLIGDNIPVGHPEILQIKPVTDLSISKLTLPPFIPFSINDSQPKVKYDIKDKLKQLDDKFNPVSIMEGRDPVSSLTLKSKKRLDDFRARLEAAREKLLHLGDRRASLGLLPVKTITKREVLMNKEVSNFLDNKDSFETGGETMNMFEKIISGSRKHNTARPYENAMFKPATVEEAQQLHRMVREIDTDDKTMAEAGSTLQASSLETKRQSSNDLPIPSYLTPLNKWIIPLSNYTENIVLNNKVFPVKLYGILSDNWIEKNNDAKSSNTISERRRKSRSLQYSCIRDRFNDYESEEDEKRIENAPNVGSRVVRDQTEINVKPLSKDFSASYSIEENHKKNASDTPIQAGELFRKMKRSLNDDIQRNENEMKALLTNEIVKDGPVDESLNSDMSEDVVHSKLQETLSKVVSNKTGIHRMLELAKQYQQTNPKSLEIFSDNNRKVGNNTLNSAYSESEEENRAVEIIDDESNLQNELKTSKKNGNAKTNFTRKSIKLDLKSNSTIENDEGNNDLKNETENSDDILSSLAKYFEGFFKSIGNVIKSP